MSDDSGTVISGEGRTEVASLLALRGALKLETRGMRRSRRPTARQIANEITGQNHRTAVGAYEALNAHIVEKLGKQYDLPL